MSRDTEIWRHRHDLWRKLSTVLSLIHLGAVVVLYWILCISVVNFQFTENKGLSIWLMAPWVVVMTIYGAISDTTLSNWQSFVFSAIYLSQSPHLRRDWPNANPLILLCFMHPNFTSDYIIIVDNLFVDCIWLELHWWHSSIVCEGPIISVKYI